GPCWFIRQNPLGINRALNRLYDRSLTNKKKLNSLLTLIKTTEAAMSYRYDPELAPLIPLLPNAPFHDPVAARSQLRQMMEPLNADIASSGLNIEDISIPGGEGNPRLPLRVYRPLQPTGAVPALLYIHGGGFVVGDLDSEHGSCVSIAR